MVVDGVIATQNSAGDFVRDQTRRHRQDTRTSRFRRTSIIFAGFG